MASSYSVRATADARVSTPLHRGRCPTAGPSSSPSTPSAPGSPDSATVGRHGTDGRVTGRAAGSPRNSVPGRTPGATPLIEVARTKTRDEAMAALEEWRRRHPEAAAPATGRCARRRYARAEFDLVSDPDQPATSRPTGGRRRRISSPTTVPWSNRTRRDAADIAVAMRLDSGVAAISRSRTIAAPSRAVWRSWPTSGH